jgi:hypothetical protein
VFVCVSERKLCVSAALCAPASRSQLPFNSRHYFNFIPATSKWKQQQMRMKKKKSNHNHKYTLEMEILFFETFVSTMSGVKTI